MASWQVFNEWRHGRCAMNGVMAGVRWMASCQVCDEWRHGRCAMNGVMAGVH